MNKNRNISLDILRIISMIMIISLHYLNHGQVLEKLDFGTLNYNISYFIKSLCIVAVNCYILISSYFLIDKNFNIKRIIKIGLEVIIYSILIYFILVITNVIDFNKVDLIKSIFPITTGSYWFVSSYIVFLFLSLFLNKLIKAINKREHQLLLMILFIFNSVLSFVPGFSFMGVNSGYGVVWFVNLYLIAAYIKNNFKDWNIKNYLNYYFLGTILLMLSIYVLYFIKTIFNSQSLSEIYMVFNYNSPFVLFSSITLFCYFLNIKKEFSTNVKKLISFFATSTFSVYLIHDNSHVRSILWSDILNIGKYVNSNYIWIHFACSVLLVFILCILIDKIMKKTITSFIKKI